MPDKRSMQFAKPGNCEALDELSRHAFVMMYADVVRQSYGAVDVFEVTEALVAGEALFVDELERLGHTQEAVVEALEELVIKRRIKVFVLFEMRRVEEVLPSTVTLLQAFRRLDVILTKRVA